MIDREKVIKGLECLITNKVDCDGCPYNEGENSSCLRNIAKDALELLKEQEPVKPVVLIDTWVCGKCKAKLERQALIGPNVLISENFNYCPGCGRKVKWDD